MAAPEQIRPEPRIRPAPPDDRLFKALTWLMGREFWEKAARECVLDREPEETSIDKR